MSTANIKVRHFVENKSTNVGLFKRFRLVLFTVSHHVIYVSTFILVIYSSVDTAFYDTVRDAKIAIQLPDVEPIQGLISDHGTVFDYLSQQLLPNVLGGNRLSNGLLFLTGISFRFQIEG